MFFGWGGIVVGKLCRVKLAGLGEEIRWLGDLIDILFCNLMHMLDFEDVAL